MPIIIDKILIILIKCFNYGMWIAMGASIFFTIIDDPQINLSFLPIVVYNQVLEASQLKVICLVFSFFCFLTSQVICQAVLAVEARKKEN